MMYRFGLLGLFLLLVAFIIQDSHSQLQPCPPARDAPEVLKGLALGIEKVWNSTTDWRRWEGVGFNSDGKVVNITLVSKGLRGTLQSIWDELPSLEVLDLSMNNISALNVTGCVNQKLKTLNLSGNALSELPDDLSTLVELETLDLSDNHLMGKVPDLQGVRFLNLSFNNFTGAVSVSNNVKLEVLDVSKNSYVGSIPTDISRLGSLKVLNMSRNNFTGTIPKALGQLMNLTRLVLSDNLLEGEIPDELGNCSNLFQIDLTGNKLVGGIPESLGRLPDLCILSAGSNNLSSPLEFKAGTFQNLVKLYLPKNNFTGRVPSSLGNLKLLTGLYLGSNHLTGPIPPELGNCTRLVEIWINVNHLTEPIPRELFELNSLKQLVLSNNNISGSIPEGISRLKKLTDLWLEDNNFSGSLPPSLGNLSELLILSASRNKLVGTIPETYMNMSSLIGLDVGSNNMSGIIPEALSKLHELQFLILTNNGFNGPVPHWLADLKNLRAIDFSSNQLTGIIPVSIGNLFSTVHLYKSNNETPLVYVGTLVYTGYALPVTLDLSGNWLSGSIPEEIGNLTKIQVLDLSRNNLTGEIPATLGKALNLFRVNLSKNQLTGSIPSLLANLSFLTEFDVSHNKLEGMIPLSAQLSGLNESMFSDNKDLCGRPLNVSCKTGDNKGNTSTSTAGRRSRSSRSFRKIMPIMITVCAALFVCGFLAMYFALARRRHKLHSNGEGSCDKNVTISMTFSEKLPEHIRPEKLAAATNNYSQMNIVGDGGFGVVYRAVLETGTVVAVKKLTSGGLQGDREFHAELVTLGDLKHKNLVPLLGYCSDGNERLLIYKYLKNGSLDTWLYCREAGMKPLDWQTRLKIARGAAQGIAYLHEGGDRPSIIHRDIKVSNILLDDQFEAHVSDFGLARLVDAGKTHVSTDVAGTIGYIPPEYGHNCTANPKGDVYSFGVVCLEILTGKRPTDVCFRKTGTGHMVSYVQDLKNVEEFRMALDASLLVECDESSSESLSWRMEQMVELMRIACCCCRDAPSKRPSMQEVANMLEKLEKLWLSLTPASSSAIDQIELTTMV